MERVNHLLSSPLYQEYLRKLNEDEKDRFFCRHGYMHCLEVARLCWIFILENGLDYARDVVYAAAILHDLGRCETESVETGKACHADRGARLAGPILAAAGYSPQERKLICGAIAEHRKEDDEEYASELSRFLSKADKYSRLCGECPAAAHCYKHENMPQRYRLLY